MAATTRSGHQHDRLETNERPVDPRPTRPPAAAEGTRQKTATCNPLSTFQIACKSPPMTLNRRWKASKTQYHFIVDRNLANGFPMNANNSEYLQFSGFKETNCSVP